MEFKEGQKHASKLADISEFHTSFKDAGYVLTDRDLIIDIDNLPKPSIEKLIQTFGIKTQVVWTSRGVHLYYQKPTQNFRGARTVCPLGFEVEYKHIKNTKAITIKQDGVMRQIDNEGVREPLPDYFYHKGKFDDLLGLGDGDGRNQKLHAHKFKVMGIQNYKRVLRFINEYVFAEPLPEEELKTVIRDEELRAEKDGEYHAAMTLIRMLKVTKFGDALYMYDGKKYVSGEKFRHRLASELRGQKIRYINEVIEQMNHHLLNVEQPRSGFDVKFKNGILRDGRFIEVDSPEFTPYYIDIEYKEEAGRVEAVDRYLDQLTEGDTDYRNLILESMAHTFITNAEFKRQLAKFFIFIGDGGNGKGTLLTVIRYILGNENCSSLSINEMTKESYFTSMAGKLVNLGDDVEDKPIDDKQMKILKNLSTCDFISMRKLYQQAEDVILTLSLMFTSNHILKSFEKGEAFKRRVVWCPIFSKPTKKDPRFITTITSPEALEYWIRLILEAYFRLYENQRFSESQKVNDYNEEYHEENNGTLTFIRDYPIEYFIGKRPPEIYSAYESWAEENGVNVQSARLLKETIKQEYGLTVKAKMINKKTAKVYDV